MAVDRASQHPVPIPTRLEQQRRLTRPQVHIFDTSRYTLQPSLSEAELPRGRAIVDS